MAESPARKRGKISGEESVSSSRPTLKVDEKSGRAVAVRPKDADPAVLRAEFSVNFQPGVAQKSKQKLTIGRTTWHLEAWPGHDNKKVQVYAQCTFDGAEIEDEWAVQVQCRLNVVDHEEPYTSQLYYKYSADRLSANLDERTTPLEIPMEYLKNSEHAKIIKRGKFTVEARLQVLLEAHRRVESLLDFSEPSAISDAVLVVEGKRLHVGRQILANRSKFFERLFYGDFREAREAEVEIKDVTLEDFTRFLEVLYGHRPTNLYEEDFALRLADRFDCPQITADCEQLLINEMLELDQALRLAAKYNLCFLMDHVLEKLVSKEQIVYFLESQLATHYPPNLIQALYIKMHKLPNDHLR